MRVTTWLLMDYFPQSISLLIESFLMGDGNDEAFGESGIIKLTRPTEIWSDIAIGEHMELIMDAINNTSKMHRINELLYGFCSAGNIEMIKLAISRGASDFDTGLIFAISGDQIEAGRIMLSHGAKIKDGVYANHVIKEAVMNCDYETCKLIKDAGGMDRNMFIKHATMSGEMRVLELVDDPTPQEAADIFAYQCMHNCYAEVETCLKGFSDDTRSQAATYGIEYAVALPCDDVVKLLLEHKADPNVGLSHACERGHQTTVEILIAANATACTCGRSIAEHNPEYGKKRKRESQDEAMREFNEKWAKILDKQNI